MQRRIFLEAWSSSLFRSAKFTCQKKTTHKILFGKKTYVGKQRNYIQRSSNWTSFFYPNLSKSQNIRHKMKISLSHQRFLALQNPTRITIAIPLPPPRLYLSTLLSQSLYPVSSKPGFYLSQLNHHVPPKNPNSTTPSPSEISKKK